MKIGVITFSCTKDNYGQILQIFALQSFLKRLGHEPFLIRYREEIQLQTKFKLKNVLKYLIFFPKYLRWYFGQMMEKRNSIAYEAQSENELRKFDEFITNHISTTEEIYDAESIYARTPEAEAYICGSDQIWGGSWPYYLSFAPDSTTKIAYAPSFGGIQRFAPEYEDRLRQLLKRFDLIGMREESGVLVCERLGRPDAVQVVDPTLLLTQESYDPLRIKTQHAGEYLFLYLLGNPISRDVRDFYSFAASKGLQVIYVASQGRRDHFAKTPAQIGEWVDMLANAKYVITNSYHCTVFSLIYRKKFIVVPLDKGYARMNTRIEELLSKCDLTSRILLNQKLSAIEEDISFSKFTHYQQEETKKSRSLLITALKQKCQN